MTPSSAKQGPEVSHTVQSKSSDPLSKLLQQNTGHYKDTPISSIFDLWQLTLSFWLSLDAFTTIESEICEKCEQIKDASSQWQGGRGCFQASPAIQFLTFPMSNHFERHLGKICVIESSPSTGTDASRLKACMSWWRSPRQWIHVLERVDSQNLCKIVWGCW